jgi:DNA-directed RNA polymerase specialized sigma24 family protein
VEPGGCDAIIKRTSDDDTALVNEARRLAVLDQVLARLQAEFRAAGKTAIYEGLKEALTMGRGAPYAELGARLGMSEGAVKVAVHRLRRRYRELLREEIAQTVAGPDEVEDEIRHLLACLV